MAHQKPEEQPQRYCAIAKTSQNHEHLRGLLVLTVSSCSSNQQPVLKFSLGELVCFFAAPPRIFRGVNGQEATSPAKSSKGFSEDKDDDGGSRIYQSPTLVLEAVRRLSFAASDRPLKAEIRRSDSGEHVTRLMTTLLTISRHRPPGAESSQYSPNPNGLVTPSRHSTVLISRTVSRTGSDKAVAGDYIFQAPTISDVCNRNADFARLHGRFDHERIFRTLGALLKTWTQAEDTQAKHSIFLMRGIVNELYGLN